MPNDPFARGARLFDEGAFFDAHEAWEEYWLVETDETTRRLLQGLIQISAGFHKLMVVGSVASGTSLIAKGLAKIDASGAAVSQMRLGAFADGVHECARALAGGRFDRAAIPKLAPLLQDERPSSPTTQSPTARVPSSPPTSGVH